MAPDAETGRDGPGKESGGFCCQAPPDPALRCEPQGLWMRLHHRITRRGEPRHSCRWQLYVWPDNGGYHAERKPILYAPVDPVSPPPETASRLDAGSGGGAGHCPRVRRFITMTVYRHSRIAPAIRNIGILAAFANAASPRGRAARRTAPLRRSGNPGCSSSAPLAMRPKTLGIAEVPPPSFA